MSGFLGNPGVLDGEQPALSRVEELLASRPIASWVNLVEVYYRVERDHGRAAADETIALLRATLAPDLPGTARMIEVARLKARAAIALGDCFAVVTAAAHDVVLLTGNPEILQLADSPCRVEICGAESQHRSPHRRLPLRGADIGP